MKGLNFNIKSVDSAILRSILDLADDIQKLCYNKDNQMLALCLYLAPRSFFQTKKLKDT